MLLITAAIAVIVLTQTLYTVSEADQVVITQFGRPVGEAITEPGLKAKVPFIQVVNRFEKRFLEWDGDPNQIPTRDKKFIYVDTYARWRISDPLQFFRRLTNERGAISRLNDILDGETRNVIAKHDIEETVRSENRSPIPSDDLSDILDSLMTISVGREELQRMVLEAANQQTRGLGIEVLDFRIKRVNYVEEVRTQVYERMRSERFRIAERFRSEGQGQASRINGEKERELRTIQSEAFRVSEEIMGQADARAAGIYSSAYNRSARSRNLYEFVKSMETLERSLDTTAVIVLGTDSELFRYLKQMR